MKVTAPDPKMKGGLWPSEVTSLCPRRSSGAISSAAEELANTAEGDDTEGGGADVGVLLVEHERTEDREDAHQTCMHVREFAYSACHLWDRRKGEEDWMSETLHV